MASQPFGYVFKKRKVQQLLKYTSGPAAQRLRPDGRNSVCDEIDPNSPDSFYPKTPNCSGISQTVLSQAQPAVSKALKLISSWKTQYPWIVYIETRDVCLCEVCKWFLESGRKFSTTKKLRHTFTVSGFNDWKHALEKSRGFQQHEASDAHIEAVRAKAIFVGNIQGLDLQLNATNELQRIHGRIAIKCVVDAILTLSRQNIAFRGHDANEGNLMQILGMVARNENGFLREWLRRSQKWTSADSVNEILQLLHNDILRRVLKDVRESFHGLFGVIIDETTDIKNTEQTSNSIRYVDSEFIPIEVFVGFVETPSTSGIALYGQLQKTLLALNLDIARLRSQGYDGASNMRGKFRGLSSRVLTDFRKAIYSYCSGHCLNLILQDSLDSHFLKDATAVLKDVVNFVSKSPKREKNSKSFAD